MRCFRTNLVKAREQPAETSLKTVSPFPGSVPAAQPITPPQTTAHGIGERSAQKHDAEISQQQEDDKPHGMKNGHSQGQNGASAGLHSYHLSSELKMMHLGNVCSVPIQIHLSSPFLHECQ